MLTLCQKLVATRPDNAEWKARLGMAHNNLGKIALQRGDLATAINQYAADDRIESELAARDPKNNDQRETMLTVRAILGRTLALAGDITTGKRDLQEAVEIAAQLKLVDPNNTSFQEDYAHCASQLSRLQRLSNDPSGAAMTAAQSLATYILLTKQDPANTGWRREFAEVQLEQAEQSRAAGNAYAARKQARAALTMLDPLLVKQPDDRTILLATLGTKLLLAAVSEASTAQRLRNEALSAMQAVKSGGGDPRLLALQADALLGLGRKAEAQPLIQQLWNSGYRDAALVVRLQRERIDYPVNAAFQQTLLATSGSIQK
jgi:tetratricopeptide (TPR) repeat protein